MICEESSNSPVQLRPSYTVRTPLKSEPQGVNLSLSPGGGWYWPSLAVIQCSLLVSAGKRLAPSASFRGFGFPCFWAAASAYGVGVVFPGGGSRGHTVVDVMDMRNVYWRKQGARCRLGLARTLAPHKEAKGAVSYKPHTNGQNEQLVINPTQTGKRSS